MIVSFIFPVIFFIFMIIIRIKVDLKSFCVALVYFPWICMRKSESIVLVIKYKCFYRCAENAWKKYPAHTHTHKFMDGENVCSSFLKRDMLATFVALPLFVYLCVCLFLSDVLSLFLFSYFKMFPICITYIRLYLFIYFASFTTGIVRCRHLYSLR